MLSEPVHGISDGGVCATSKALDQPDRGLCLSLECYVTVGLLPGCRLGLCRGGGGRAGLGLRCRNATLLEVTCHGSRFYYPILLYICALEIFAVKTTSLSKVLLLFFAFSF